METMAQWAPGQGDVSTGSLSSVPPSDWVAMTVRDQLRPTPTPYKVYEDAVIKAKLKNTLLSLFSSQTRTFIFLFLNKVAGSCPKITRPMLESPEPLGTQ